MGLGIGKTKNGIKYDMPLIGNEDWSDNTWIVQHLHQLADEIERSNLKISNIGISYSGKNNIPNLFVEGLTNLEYPEYITLPSEYRSHPDSKDEQITSLEIFLAVYISEEPIFVDGILYNNHLTNMILKYHGTPHQLLKMYKLCDVSLKQLQSLIGEIKVVWRIDKDAKLTPEEFKKLNHNRRWEASERLRNVSWMCEHCGEVIDYGSLPTKMAMGERFCGDCDGILTRRTGGGQGDPFNYSFKKSVDIPFKEYTDKGDDYEEPKRDSEEVYIEKRLYCDHEGCRKYIMIMEGYNGGFVDETGHKGDLRNQGFVCKKHYK